ncbi:MAG: hypothetical protein HQM13_20460 [SAR324 cluster bacterium]|nr:hypothetical protein [SAR324 cluster bacterium]
MAKFFKEIARKKIFLLFLMTSSLVLVGCGGGSDGDDGKDVDPAIVESLTARTPETCIICHENMGDKHFSVYEDYADTSELGLTVDSVSSALNTDGTTYTVTVTFSITKNGLAYVDTAGLPGLSQKRMYAANYDSTTRSYLSNASFGSFTPTSTLGTYTAVSSSAGFAPESSNAMVYAYIAEGTLDTEIADDSHVHLYNNVANAALAFGTAQSTNASAYVSSANVSGCEKCHGAPYMKHGYRNPVVTGIPDFASCKACHYDTRSGGHEDWQILVDDPERFVTVHDGSVPLTAAEEAQYAYTANVMNDTHMAHAMEFPYPQSMSNCATCHDGKLDMILTDANFTVTTCKSCHPVNGPSGGTDAHRAPALTAILPSSISSHSDLTTNCVGCHTAGGIGPAFSSIHTGYDTEIYADAAGTKYADIFVTTVDSASLSGNTLTVSFSTTKTGGTGLSQTAGDIVPTVAIGLYGYDTKDFIISPHGRSFDDNGDGTVGQRGVDFTDLEYEIGEDVGNPRFTEETVAAGSWRITANLGPWSDKIDSGVVKRVEIGVMPELRNSAGDVVALNAPSRTFDLTTNAFDDSYFTDIVRVDGCNTCHDSLATTFHDGKRSGNVRICKMCHSPQFGGSHLEMQSRSIDSYVHAIHSFQPFDPGDVDMTDPVEKVKYELHIEHTFPMFTIKNCEACHNAGTFDVPNQTKSLPGVLSGTDTLPGGRNILPVASAVVGPATRACGGCHRATYLKEDDVHEFNALNQHMEAGGYWVENESGAFEGIITTIMAFFQ